MKRKIYAGMDVRRETTIENYTTTCWNSAPKRGIYLKIHGIHHVGISRDFKQPIFFGLFFGEYSVALRENK
ncbi:hypothetical protein DPV73_04215 [Leptospira mayottensis]|nr:hypothetical protein DPV73_04215 [Leptospira mayottensis]